MPARPPPSPRAAELGATLVALGLHLGLLALGLAIPGERPMLARSSHDDEAGTWLDLEELRPGAPAAAVPAGAAVPVPAAAAAAARAPAAAPVPAPESAPAPEPEPAPEPASESASAPEPGPAPEAPAGPAAPPAPGSPDEYGGPPPAEPGVAPGLGGTPVWALPGVIAPRPEAPAAPTAAPAAPVDIAAAGKVLNSTLQSRDKELGLQMPGAGVVATAVADAVRGLETPGDARAKFEVKLGGDGRVQGVRVISTTGGDAGVWERAAQKAAGALASRQLQVGEAGREGATVIVKIESKVTYPSGSKEKTTVAPVCAEDVLLEAIKNMEELAGQKRPGMIQLPDGSFCIPVGIAGRGDLSDIGAHMQKVVSSSFDVVLPGAMKLQADEVLPVDTRAPWLKNLPSKGPRLPPPKKWQKKKKKKKK